MPVKQPDKSAEAAADSGEPVELWNADEKDKENDRLIEKLAEAEANGQALIMMAKTGFFPNFPRTEGNEMH